MYRGIERRATTRCPGPRPGAILLKADSIIECTVRDFSLGGVAIELPSAISILSTEFDLTFGHFTRRCETVWRRVDRMGLKVKSTRFAL
jgi:PilZ domain-containing protein